MKNKKHKSRHLALSFVLDLSQSMTTNFKDHKQANAVASICSEINQIPDIDYSIYGYNSSMYRIKNFGHMCINKVLHELELCGGQLGTGPTESILTSIVELMTHKHQSKVLVLTTDGDWTAGNIEEVKQALKQINSVYTIGIAIEHGKNTLDKLGLDHVESLDDPKDIFDIVYRALKEIFK